jgi:hypothetical protein
MKKTEDNFGVVLEKIESLHKDVIRNQKESNGRDDELKRTIEKNHEDNNAYHKESNGRLKRLEVWRAIILGGGTVVTAIVIPLVVHISNLTVHSISEVKETLEVYAEKQQADHEAQVIISNKLEELEYNLNHGNYYLEIDER